MMPIAWKAYIVRGCEAAVQSGQNLELAFKHFHYGLQTKNQLLFRAPEKNKKGYRRGVCVCVGGGYSNRFHTGMLRPRSGPFTLSHSNFWKIGTLSHTSMKRYPYHIPPACKRDPFLIPVAQKGTPFERSIPV